jgi:hypothetical protein
MPLRTGGSFYILNQSPPVKGTWIKSSPSQCAVLQINQSWQWNDCRAIHTLSMVCSNIEASSTPAHQAAVGRGGFVDRSRPATRQVATNNKPRNLIMVFSFQESGHTRPVELRQCENRSGSLNTTCIQFIMT